MARSHWWHCTNFIGPGRYVPNRVEFDGLSTEAPAQQRWFVLDAHMGEVVRFRDNTVYVANGGEAVAWAAERNQAEGEFEVTINAGDAVNACDQLLSVVNDLKELDGYIMDTLQEAIRDCVGKAGLKATCRVVGYNKRGIDACAKIIAHGVDQ